MNHLHFGGIIEFGNAIILIQVAEIPDLNLHTKGYPHKLAAITRSLPDKAQPISLE